MTELDKLLRLQALVDAAGIPNAGVALGPPLRIDYLPSATTLQRTQGVALLASFNPLDQSAQDVFDAGERRKVAKLIASTEPDKYGVTIRAVALTLLDLINQGRSPAQQVTPAQLRTAILNKIDGGTAG